MTLVYLNDNNTLTLVTKTYFFQRNKGQVEQAAGRAAGYADAKGSAVYGDDNAGSAVYDDATAGKAVYEASGRE